MAKLYISEYSTTGTNRSSAVQISAEPCLRDQQPLDFSAGAVASLPFLAQTIFVRVHTDAPCSIAFGSTPTATTSNKRLPANTTEYFGVQPGSKISVIANT